MSISADSRLVRDANEHLDRVLRGVEMDREVGIIPSSPVKPATMPVKVADLPFAHPVKQEEAPSISPQKYVHLHKWQRKPSFEERVKAVTPETIAKLNFDLEELRRRREASTYRRMNWEDVLMVQAGKPHKKNRRKGNGKGRPPASLEALREKELNGKHLD